MGYQNEGASPNKYQGMKDYCDRHVVKQLARLRSRAANTDEQIKALKASNEYQATPNPLVPMAAIDGGLATIFPGEVEETKILKVSAGWGPEVEHLFSDKLSSFIHIHTGVLKWPEGVERTLEEVVDDLMEVVLNHDLVQRAVQILNLDLTELDKALRGRIQHLKPRHKDGITGFEDNLREIIELSAMVVFTDLYNQDQKILDNFRQQKLLVPYVLVKDGTLFPSKITASSYFADAVSNYFNRGDIFVIGVIKNSRFINKENAWAKVIATYAAEVKHNTFFRLPKAVELSIDRESDKHLYHRYFLSLYGGEAIFEIQVPQLLSQDDLKRKQIFDGLAAQVTLMYGGSVSTNSYAHQEASLPESEARFLTDQLREDLRTTESEETADE